MNAMCKNARQQLKELIQYITFLERENLKLRKKLKKQNNERTDRNSKQAKGSQKSVQ